MIPHPVDAHVGKQLRVQRVIMGLSQEALAKAVGITFQQVQKYERGINRMSASRLHDFSRVLSVAVSFFFEGYEGPVAEGGDYRYPEKSGASPGVAEGGSEEEFDYEQAFTRETLELMRCFHKLKNGLIKRRFVELMRAVAEDKTLLDAESA